jgi:pimeloyl-ACP methyl ester carboxylesterase
VAENPAVPNGRTIDLHVAWLPAGDRGEPAADPVFFLAGGPGQAASDHAGTVSTALREVLKQRHVFLVDQRGTGKSAALACPEAVEARFKASTDPNDIVEYARLCAEGLKADARFYTTSHAVADLEAVRRALGVQQVNLVGVSYGTRVAQQYAAAHPAATRTLVLDGVVPNDLVAGGEFARMFERSLTMRSKACSADPACAKRYPMDLRSQVAALRQKLDAAPVEVEYRDPATNAAKRDTLTGDTVSGLAFLFSYMPQAASLLPVVVDEASQGRYGPLMALASLGGSSTQGSMNRPMQWSVICAEDAPRYVADPADAQTVLGADMSRLFFSACTHWPRGARPAGFEKPLATKVPALLMSGELDPVTPPEYGARVAKALPNARHLELAGQGHNVFATGCMPKLVGQFIERADAKSLDAKCLDSIGPVPPFTSFNGWEP